MGDKPLQAYNAVVGRDKEKFNIYAFEMLKLGSYGY